MAKLDLEMLQLREGGWSPKHLSAVLPFWWQMLKSTYFVLVLYYHLVYKYSDYLVL